MGVYTDSALVIDKRYLVQEVSKFPKKKDYMIGQYCVLKQIVGSTAHVMFTSRMTEIPVRSLIQVPEYTAKGVQAKNADGFVVVTQNTLGIPVGTAYLNPEEVTKTHFKLTVAGKLVSIPLDIVAALKKNKALEKPVNAEKVSKATGVSPQLVVVVDELVAPHSNREDIKEVPPSLMKLLPGVNLVELRDTLLSSPMECFDYEGNVHSSIAECDKANTRIRHKGLTKLLVRRANQRFEEEAEAIRNAH